MRNSEMPGLIQTREMKAAWALYMSKYLDAYRKQHGIPIVAVTVQNEPHVAKQFLVTYECCGFNSTHETEFLRDYLGPQLRADHPDVAILIFDDQKPELVDCEDHISILFIFTVDQLMKGVAFL